MVAFRKDRKPEGWKYGSYEELVLAEGTTWTEAIFEKNGPLKNCYENSITYALDNGGLYCEGYALGAFMPVMHAWVLMGDDVIETTWREPGTEYIGVAMDPVKAMLRSIETGYYGLIDNDWMNKHMLLREGFKSLIRKEGVANVDIH